MISFLDIRKIFALKGLGSLALAYDLMMNRVRLTVPDVSLYEAMERMKQENLEVLAVVDTEEHRKLLGMLERRRIQNVLREEILRRRGDALLTD